MKDEIGIVPRPRKLERRSGVFGRTAGRYVRIEGAGGGRPVRAAGLVARSLSRLGSRALETVAGGPDDGVIAGVGLDPKLGAEEYRLTVDPERVTVRGGTEAGVWYAAQTLVQLARLYPAGIPCLRIDDGPDFAARGILLDVSRDRVPTLATLYRMVDQMAEWKLNQLQLYTEHTFAYRAHPLVWAEASPLTGEDVLALDAYCRERHVQLVPNQNSFGHMDRWLRHAKYRPLAEAPDGFDLPWGGRADGPFSLCPGDPGSLALLESLYDELLPHFSSGMFNVGCDETWDLGQGRSRAVCEQRGRERVYLEFLLKVHDAVRRRGRTLQFWGDIILHKPELIRELPDDLVALEWGYEADHPFDRDGKCFREAGVPFYVCPGTSSWNSIAGRADNALANLSRAAECGQEHGAIGYLNTDWGDGGHHQVPPVSWLGYLAGAAYSWCRETNRDLDVPEALSAHVFRDASGVMGRVVHDLGNVYRAVGTEPPNASALNILLFAPLGDRGVTAGITEDGLEAAQEAVDAAIAPLDRARMGIEDATLVAEEIRFTADMLSVACRVGRIRLGHRGSGGAAEVANQLGRLLGEHRRLWLARSRPGGLQDSSRRLEDRVRELRAIGR